MTPYRMWRLECATSDIYWIGLAIDGLLWQPTTPDQERYNGMVGSHLSQKHSAT